MNGPTQSPVDPFLSEKDLEWEIDPPRALVAVPRGVDSVPHAKIQKNQKIKDSKDSRVFPEFFEFFEFSSFRIFEFSK